MQYIIDFLIKVSGRVLMDRIREKRVCSGCCIIFSNSAECPRCGKGENLHPYFEAESLRKINTGVLPKTR